MVDVSVPVVLDAVVVEIEVVEIEVVEIEVVVYVPVVDVAVADVLLTVVVDVAEVVVVLVVGMHVPHKIKHLPLANAPSLPEASHDAGVSPVQSVGSGSPLHKPVVEVVDVIVVVLVEQLSHNTGQSMM